MCSVRTADELKERKKGEQKASEAIKGRKSFPENNVECDNFRYPALLLHCLTFRFAFQLEVLCRHQRSRLCRLGCHIECV